MVARRYGEGATIVTSNLSFGNWDQSFASEATVAGVRLGHVLHHASVVQISGGSYRLTRIIHGGGDQVSAACA